MLLDRLEKRREPRQPAQGMVNLSIEVGARACELTATLLDTSGSGFRAAHSCAELSPGSLVSFNHASRQGTARVVWNRISGGRTETGFFVLA